MAYNPEPYRGRRTDSHKRGGGGGKKKGCCPMVEAGRAVRRGRYRLARRYAGLAVRRLVLR